MQNKYIPTEGPDDVFDHLSTVFARGSQWQCALNTGLVVVNNTWDQHSSRQLHLTTQIGDTGDVAIGIARYCGYSRGVLYTVTAKGTTMGHTHNAQPVQFYDPGALEVSEHILSVVQDLRCNLGL